MASTTSISGRVSTAEYGSDVMVDVLRDLGIEYVALNPGATFRGLHDSIVNHAGNQHPELILCTHEMIAVAIAHGYGKAAGKPMAAAVHNIVGLLNASMSVFNAWLDRAGVLVLGGTGPLDAAQRRPWIDWVHTANVQGQAVRDFVKWDDQPGSVAAAVSSLIRAHHLVTSEPKGPVYVCFDSAIQETKLAEPFELPDFSRFPTPTRLQADPAALEQAAELLLSARRPVVLTDFLGRSPEACNGLVRLAESLSLPVVAGGDLYNFPSRHPLCVTESKEELIREADVVLALDVYDLQQVLTGGLNPASRTSVDLIPPDAKLIDVSLRQLAVKSWADDQGKLYPSALSIAADTALAVPALADLVQRRLDDEPDRKGGLVQRQARIAALHDANQAKAREAAARTGDGQLSLAFVAGQLGEVVEGVDWVLGNGDLRGWTDRLWDLNAPYQSQGSRAGGGLGKGFGHAIGVALANRDNGRVTINIQSDGDLLFTPGAIWTAVHHRVPMLVVMYNNRSYGNDIGHQATMARVRGRPDERKTIGINIDDPNVDFAAMARSFGAWAEGPIERPEELKPALERALREVVEHGRVALVDVITELL